MKIAITGSSGLVGSELREALKADGHDITRVVRDRERARRRGFAFWNPDGGEVDERGLEGHDVVIHLAGANLFSPWTRKHREAIRRSRVQGTQLLSSALAGLASPPAVLLSASALGYYGDRSPDEPLTESAAGGDGFLSRVVRGWEAATEPAEVGGIRVVHLRFGVIMSPEGGLLGTVLPLFRLGLGGIVGSGDQVWSWVARPELPHIVRHLIETNSIAGPVNVSAPEAVTAAEFSRTLGRVVNRPVLFRIPASLARIAPGEMADELALSSARVVPRRLLESGYAFRHPAFEPALRSLLA